MVQFIVYAVTGFLIVSFNLFMWGFSNGPEGVAPYLALLGGLLLFVVASAVALFLPRVSACVALFATAMVLSWPATLLFSHHDASTAAALLCILPVAATAIAALQLILSRQQPWLSRCTFPHWAWRVAIAVLPLVGFALCFNAPAVLHLVFKYPFA